MKQTDQMLIFPAHAYLAYSGGLLCKVGRMWTKVGLSHTGTVYKKINRFCGFFINIYKIFYNLLDKLPNFTSKQEQLFYSVLTIIGLLIMAIYIPFGWSVQ